MMLGIGLSEGWVILNKEAIIQMNPDKVPGPDGYNAIFFQKNWKFIKGDVVSVVKSFFTTG